tara:strand:- start:2200 stop:3105 length:906 start_codon:yes stop_codon:yes gene_type:complete
MHTWLQGVLPALITPMHKNGQIDATAWRRLLIAFDGYKECHAMVLLGSTGEGAMLSFNERNTLLDISKAMPEKRRIIAITAASTAEACRQAEQAAKYSANGLMLSMPYYVRPTEEGIYRHITQVARTVTLPILLYDVPQRVGVGLSDELIIQCSHISNIVGIKDASAHAQERMQRISKQLPSDWVYLAGDDSSFHSMCSHGARGVVSVAANVLYLPMALCFNAIQQGQSDRAQEIINTLTPLISELSQQPNPSAIKYLTSKVYHCDAYVRPPLLPVSASTQKRLMQLYQTIDPIDAKSLRT